jgi:hypothetical protein
MNGIAMLSLSRNLLFNPNLHKSVFGGYNIDIVEDNDAFKLLSPKEQTDYIIDKLEGITDSNGVVGAPACEFAKNTPFPNGIYS